MAAFQSFHQSNFIHVDKYRAFVTTPRSHFNECSHFQTLQHGPFQSFEEECYFSGHSPVNLVHGHSHYVIASEIAALTAEDFRPKLSGFRAARIELLSAKRACCLLVFYPIHSHTRFPHPPEKTLGPITAFAGKLTSSIWQPMKRKFVRILVVVLAAFALFAFVYPDDLSENDTACGQSGMLKESSVRTPTHWDRQGAHRDQQALALDSTRPLAPNKKTCSPSSSASATSPMLLSLAACVLRC